MGRLFLEYVEAPGCVTNKAAQGFGRLAPGRLLSVTGYASDLRSGQPRPNSRSGRVGRPPRLLSTQAPCVYVCLSCRTHLSAHDSIISKAFQGRHGRAYLFGDVVNINSGPTENRLLLTGLHVVPAC
jgi:hypothetical protein